MALFNSIMFAAILWIVGAAIFMQTEYVQGWSYFDALYFSYTSLMTIGYGGEFIDNAQFDNIVWLK